MAETSIAAVDEQLRWSLRMPAGLAAETGTLAGFRVALDINRCACEGGRLSARLGPDEWLLCAPPGLASGFMGDAEAALARGHHSLVDVGHRYAAFTVDGPQAGLLLAAGCPLDLHPEAFTQGCATRTLLGKAEIVLWRLVDAPGYRVECARTFAPYVAAFLREAAREYA